MSYSPNRFVSWHQAGLYAARILHGEKPADLPVQRANKVELVINLKSWKALGLNISASILFLADEVIDPDVSNSATPCEYHWHLKKQ